jgi:hypothetical protein
MRLTRLAATTSSLLLLAASHAAAQQPPPAPPRPSLARLYQGRRAPEQSDRLSRKVRLGRDGHVSISNISGNIVVSSAAGDEVSIDAVKHGDRGSLDRVRIVIDDRPGRVDVSTDYESFRFGGNNVSVDYTVSVPNDATVELKSISGNVRVDGVKGSVRAQTVSGNIFTNNAPRLEMAKTVSGSVDMSGVASDAHVSVQSISGGVRANGLKARSLDVNTVSGEINLQSAAIERLNARLVSGIFEYSGALVRNGRYQVNAHSGDVRFTLTDNTGFELNATSFSGEIRSAMPLTTGGNGGVTVTRSRPRRGPGESLNGAYGDGSARLELRSFSGNIVISKR